MRHFRKGSVEIIKDGNLQRVHFKNKYEKSWRDELREYIKWNVDRSSASNKLRNFNEWLDEVACDLRFHSKMKTFSIEFCNTVLRDFSIRVTIRKYADWLDLIFYFVSFLESMHCFFHQSFSIIFQFSSNLL